MFIPKFLILAIALVLNLLIIASADAQQPKGTQWGLGAAVGYDRRPYRDYDDKVLPIPLVYLDSRWVRINGPMVDLKLLPDDAFQIGLRVRFVPEGYEADDSPFLAGMGDRDASFWAGGFASYRTRWATLYGEVLGDASRNSKGTRATIGVERRWVFGDVDVTPRIAVHRVSGKVVDYYYGVRADEATPDRPAYTGGSTTDVEAGVRIGYSLAPRHKLSLDLSTTRLGSSIKDSPLVDRSRRDGIRIGYLYLF